MNQVSPHELQQRLKAGERFVLLDVREPAECAVSKLSMSVNIPLSELPSRYRELDPGADIVVMCKAGVRSQKACFFLASQGYQHLSSLSSGMDGWLRDIGAAV